MRTAFCSDIHLNFIGKNEIIFFADKINKTNCDIVLISGDIAEANSLQPCLNLLSQSLNNKKIYYVCGNHDFYRSSIKETIDNCKSFSNDNINFLDNSGVKLTADVALIGQNIFYDLSVGNPNGDFDIADFQYIKELKPLMYTRQRIAYFQERALKDAVELQILVDNAVIDGCKKIIYMAHPPLDEDLSLYGERKSPSFSIGYFCNKIVGDKLKEIADQYPQIEFVALTGHSHYRASYDVDNLKMYVAGAQYYSPEIEMIIDL